MKKEYSPPLLRKVDQSVEQYLIQAEGQNLAVIDAASPADAVSIFKQRVHLGELQIPASKAAVMFTAILKKDVAKRLKFMYQSHATCWKCGCKIAIDDINMHLKVCKGTGKQT